MLWRRPHGCNGCWLKVWKKSLGVQGLELQFWNWKLSKREFLQIAFVPSRVLSSNPHIPYGIHYDYEPWTKALACSTTCGCEACLVARGKNSSDEFLYQAT